jgi:hypothetical protein
MISYFPANSVAILFEHQITVMDYDEGRVFVSGEGAVKNTVNSLARDNFTNFLRTYVSETAFCYK